MNRQCLPPGRSAIVQQLADSPTRHYIQEKRLLKLAVNLNSKSPSNLYHNLIESDDSTFQKKFWFCFFWLSNPEELQIENQISMKINLGSVTSRNINLSQVTSSEINLGRGHFEEDKSQAGFRILPKRVIPSSWPLNWLFVEVPDLHFKLEPAPRIHHRSLFTLT